MNVAQLIISKKAIVAYLKGISHNSSEETEDNHENINQVRR
jgi:hypothetical protein